uniref:Uncharacterized protein n=1 Tax=Lactuca sativa TaxID=4236 RepID=A0A9R1WCQ7_LACSA|nr:hypothetical protein LSAT_V11C200084430 [Lactuca sativa]
MTSDFGLPFLYQWKFAFVYLSNVKYLQDSDIVSHPFLTRTIIITLAGSTSSVDILFYLLLSREQETVICCCHRTLGWNILGTPTGYSNLGA